jgi:hypothetical protein
MNGKTMLTQVQRHQLVDSITKAGYLASWWENEEQPGNLFILHWIENEDIRLSIRR